MHLTFKTNLEVRQVRPSKKTDKAIYYTEKIDKGN